MNYVSVRSFPQGSEVNAVLANPKLKERMQELGGDPMPLTPDAFGKLVADETQKWAKVIRGANIHLE